MSATNPHPDRWTDRQLRDVPLPEGLLVRLRRIAASSDEDLDALLRDVVVPEGLLARLKAVPVEVDAGLDECVGAVEVPVGLAARLKRIPLAADADLNEAVVGVAVPNGLPRRLKRAAWSTDEGLDEALRDVSIPAALASSLTEIARVEVVAAASAARRRRRLSRFLHMTAAAVVLLAVAASYVAGMANLILGTYHVALSERPHLDTIGSLEGSLADPTEVQLPPVEFADDSHESLRLWANSLQVQPDLLSRRVAVSIEESSRWTSAPPADFSLLDMWGPRFASPPAAETFDRLESPRGLYPRGQQPPAVAAPFDWSFYAQYGVKPFVDPAAHKELATVQIPLGTDTNAFDRVLEQVQQGRRPRTDEVFVDDFLAAMDYQFPPPREQAMAIRTAAGPSPFAPNGQRMWLLQVAAQAIDRLPGKHPPTRLTIAVDVSARTTDGDRLRQVRQALVSLYDQLQTGDRITLVAFSDEARMVVDDAGPDDGLAWHDAIESVRPRQQAANVGEGLRAACALASLPAADQQRRLVIIADSLPYLSNDAARRIERMARQTHQQGIRIDWIDVSRQLVFDPLLERMESSADIRLHRGVSERQICRPLLSALAGRDAVAAGDATLRMRFNPKVVARYRTVGGEPEVDAAPQQVDVWVGEVSSGLFELVFHPGVSGPVGEAELTWRDPEGGVSRKIVQPISRRQFADTFVAAGPSLQLAALAAESAEVMQSSKMAQGSSLEHVQRQADLVTATLRQWPSYRRLMSLVQRAIQARQRGPSPAH